MTTTEVVETRPAELAAFVKHAQTIGADFTIRIRTDAELCAVLDAIGSHNNYDHVAAGDLLGPLVGAMGEVRVEQWCGGPALYFQLPFWSHQRIDAGPFSRMGEKYSDEQRREMAEQVRSVGRDLDADEVSVRQFPSATFGVPDHVWTGTGEHPHEIRLWWD